MNKPTRDELIKILGDSHQGSHYQELEKLANLFLEIDEEDSDPLKTFGSRAVVEIPDLQTLMQYICRNGFEHHVAINKGHTATILAEAFDTYFGFDVYHHETYW